MKRVVMVLIPLTTALISCGGKQAKTDVEWNKIIGLRLQAESHTLSSKWDKEREDDIPTTTGVLGE